MKIGIDARVLCAPILKGIGIYLQNLLAALLEVDSKNQYVLYTDGRQPSSKSLASAPRLLDCRLAIPQGERFFLWEQLRLPMELAIHRVDVLHSPANTTTLLKPCPTVVTVHDTKLLELQYRSRAERFYYLKVQAVAVRNAQRIICPSDFSKRCVMTKLGVPESKITVVYQGISSEFRPIADSSYLSSVQRKYGVTEPYLLFAGGESPAKNISKLIAAFALLKAKKDSDLQLLIPGIRTAAVRAQHEQEIRQHGLGNSVRLMDYVSTEDLVALYNRALVFVYPSLSEGFGFPPLEAMACGAPVVASQVTSIPEIVGDAGLLFDASSVSQMAETIYRAVTDEPLRDELRARGFQRVKQFRWTETAKKTLEVYAAVQS